MAITLDKSHQEDHLGLAMRLEELDTTRLYIGGILQNASVIAAGATYTASVADHNKTILLNTAAGSVVTLPLATGSGLHLKIITSVTCTSNNHIIIVTAGATNMLQGTLIGTDTDTTDTQIMYPALVGDTFDTITMNGTTKGGLVGDHFFLTDVLTGTWALFGQINQNGTVATPFSSAVS